MTPLDPAAHVAGAPNGDGSRGRPTSFLTSSSRLPASSPGWIAEKLIDGLDTGFHAETRGRVVEFELVREIRAPIEAVFNRLADIDGHNDSMPKKGSMLRRTEQTSPGELTVGTTYLDDTSFGKTPGEVDVLDPPHRLVYHWWDKTKAGKTKVEGWPAYSLEAAGPDTTVVRHQGTMHTHGVYRLATPVVRRLAIKERTAVVDALKASFES